MFNIIKYFFSALLIAWYVDAQSHGKTFFGSSYKDRNRSIGHVSHK